MILSLCVATAIALNARQASAEEQEAEKLAREIQNPIADLTTVPFQNNTYFTVGPYRAAQDLLNIQPVLPMSLGADWNLVTRVIAPVLFQPRTSSTNGAFFGLGDINPAFFFSPSATTPFVWGIGPAFLLPTATDRLAGNGKWAAGPTAVAFFTKGPWVFGALGSNLWSFTGDHRRPEVNRFTLQPVLSYGFKDGWYISSAPIITANWNTPGGKWLVPIAVNVGRVFRIGEQAVNASVGPSYFAVRSTGAPTWAFRFQVQLIFPR